MKNNNNLCLNTRSKKERSKITKTIQGGHAEEPIFHTRRRETNNLMIIFGVDAIVHQEFW